MSSTHLMRCTLCKRTLCTYKPYVAAVWSIITGPSETSETYICVASKKQRIIIKVIEMERKEVTDCTKSYRLMLSDGGEAAKVLVPFEDIALGMPGLEWC